MKSVFKPIIAVMIAAALLISFAACGGSRQNPGGDSKASAAPTDVFRTDVPTLRPDVSVVTYTIDASAAIASGKLSSEVASHLANGGLLLNKASVTMLKDQKLSATFKLFKQTQGIDIVLKNDRVVSIHGVENGACGEGSHWAVKVNGQEIDAAIDSIVFANGDTIEIVYVCD